MPEVRMSLAEAAELLGKAPNSVRSRWKAGKIRGERDNAGKVWVWVDPEQASNDKGSKEPTSKPSIEGSKSGEIKALEAHVQTLSEQLAGATAELAVLRPRAEEATRLEAERDGLKAQLDIRAEQVMDMCQQRDAARAEAVAAFEKVLAAERPRGLFARLFSSR